MLLLQIGAGMMECELDHRKSGEKHSFRNNNMLYY